MGKKKIYKYLTAALILIILGGCHLVSYEDESDINNDTIFEEVTVSVEDSSVSTQTQLNYETTVKNEVIYVHICGWVNNPGVYELPVDARLYEAIDMAGGVSDGGCSDKLNLAGVLKDGERIYVPSDAEAALIVETVLTEDKTSNISTSDKRVNINTASEEELKTLPGIGTARAKDIIKYREDKGNFKDIEDIMNVTGIKESMFIKIKDLIRT